MKIHSIFLAIAVSLITSIVVQADPVLFSPTVSSSYSGNLDWTYNSKTITTFTSDGFSIPGADGRSLNVWGTTESIPGENSGTIKITHLPTTDLAEGAVVSIGMTTIVKFTLSQAGEGTLTTSWSSLPSAITLTLNGIAVSAGDVAFNQGENTLRFVYDSFSMSLPENLSTDYSIEMTVVPEPGSWALLACGAGAIVFVARRKAARLAA